jgi:hypothetical protein
MMAEDGLETLKDGSVAAAVAAGFWSVEVDVAAATGELHSAAIAFDGSPRSSRSPTPAGRR